MTEQYPSSIGTVAQEAARLIEDMVTMARSSNSRGDDPSPYAGEPAQDPASPERAASVGAPSVAPSGGPSPSAAPACSACGGVTDGTPVACKLCPLCQGIALLRSVRPETVDRLADLASAVATTLRDMATQSRASGSGSGPGSGSERPSDGPTVQDIRVDDGDEG